MSTKDNTPKSNFFCITSLFCNELEYMSSTLIECPNLHRQKHHSYVWHKSAQTSNHLLLMGDGTAAFRPLTWRLPGLVVPARGITRYSLQGHGGTQASPPRQGSNNRGGFFWLLYTRWKSNVWPAWSEYLLLKKEKQFLCLAKLF